MQVWCASLTCNLCLINEEYASIREEETGNDVGNTGKTTPKTTPNNNRERIIAVIKDNPSVPKKAIAEELGISVDGVKYHLKKLSENGAVQYIGTSRKGHWFFLLRMNKPLFSREVLPPPVPRKTFHKLLFRKNLV